MAATSPGPSSSATLPACCVANSSARRCDSASIDVDGGVGIGCTAVEQRVEVPGDGLEFRVGYVGAS